MSEDEKKQQTTMRARRELLDLLDAEAKARGWSRTIMLEQVMAKWLKSAGHKIKIEVVV